MRQKFFIQNMRHNSGDQEEACQTFTDETFRDSLVKTSDGLIFRNKKVRVSKEVETSFIVWLILENAFM